MTDPPPCPHLPPARSRADWRLLNSHRGARRGGGFYLDCLEYGQTLWQRGRAGRAILCLDRAFGAELEAGDPAIGRWPLPYAALAWVLRRASPAGLVGNPRIHFQHYAGRMNEPRREQRRWRAWACWALTRAVRPEQPADPRHPIAEPDAAEIEERLREHGLPGEADLWRRIRSEVSPCGALLPIVGDR